jgi:hypothetical protein
MLLIGKIAFTIGSTLALATVYTFHEGVIRVDVDEARGDGAHVHFWVPATVVPMALHLAPRQNLRQGLAQARPFLPTVHALSKGLEKYPNAELIEVIDEDQHVKISTENGRLRIDVDSPDEHVHIACPLTTLRDVADQLEAQAPGV